MKGELIMAFSTLVTGILLVTILTGLEVNELLNERERKEFENS
jgi:hypothetical protein